MSIWEELTTCNCSDRPLWRSRYNAETGILIEETNSRQTAYGQSWEIENIHTTSDRTHAILLAASLTQQRRLKPEFAEEDDYDRQLPA